MQVKILEGLLESVIKNVEQSYALLRSNGLHKRFRSIKIVLFRLNYFKLEMQSYVQVRSQRMSEDKLVKLTQRMVNLSEEILTYSLNGNYDKISTVLDELYELLNEVENLVAYLSSKSRDY